MSCELMASLCCSLANGLDLRLQMSVDPSYPPMPQAHVTPQVISYASPGSVIKPKVTFRGAMITLIVGGGMFVLSLILIVMAWAIFRSQDNPGSYRATSNLEALGFFVCFLAGITFLAGLITAFIGLRGVRQREIT